MKIIDSLFNDKILLRSQQRFKNDHHRIYTEEVNKIALSSNGNKTIQTHDKITTYPYGANIFNDGLNNKAQATKNEAQKLRNNSQLLRDKSQALINESHVIKNNSQVLRDESQARVNES